MAINFPTNPANGDTYVNDNILYTYFSAKQSWKSTKILRVLTPTVEPITVTLAAGATTTGYISYSSGFLISSVTTSHAARVILYGSNTAMTNDADRPQSRDPAVSAGVILEVISTGSNSYDVVPVIYGRNTDSTNRIYYRIKNLTNASATITVNLSMQKMGV